MAGARLWKKINGDYPGYKNEWEFTLSYILMGLESNCEDCSLQIHEGQDCKKPRTHYWNKDVEGAFNPWRKKYGASYMSNENGEAEGYFGMFDGYGFNNHKLRTVVVFDSNYVKVGCGLLKEGEYGSCINEITLPPQSSSEPNGAPNEISN